jgi:hypothetical protein
VRDPLAATYPPAKPPEFFVYDSKGAKNEWTIDHNLGFPPNVATWGKDPDSKPTVPIQGEVLHTNQNSLVIKFLVPVDGVAYLS